MSKPFKTTYGEVIKIICIITQLFVCPTRQGDVLTVKRYLRFNNIYCSNETNWMRVHSLKSFLGKHTDQKLKENKSQALNVLCKLKNNMTFYQSSKNYEEIKHERKEPLSPLQITHFTWYNHERNYLLMVSAVIKWEHWPNKKQWHIKEVFQIKLDYVPFQRWLGAFPFKNHHTQYGEHIINHLQYKKGK